MQVEPTHKFDRSNAVIALAVWLTILVIYTLTKAPTLSLWDCGEFIAVSAILGIPHPPGTPVYILAGRLVSMIPFFSDISARLNFLSAFCASIAALFGYLGGVRLLRNWLGRDGSLYSRILMYAGPASGAFLLAFGKTEWTNAIEAEVYGMSMMLVMAIFWLTLIYAEKRGTSAGSRIMLIIVYLAFLGIGVHMATFLVLPVSALFFVLKKDTPAKHWFLLAAFFLLELYLIFALSSRPDEIPYFLPILIVFIFYLFYVLSFDRVPKPLLLIGLGFALSCLPVLGYWQVALAPAAGVVGVISFVGLLAFVAYISLKRLSGQKSGGKAASHALVASLFVLAAALMTLILVVNVRGYSAFLVISIILAISIGLIIWRDIDLPVLVALAGPALVILGIMPFFYGTLLALVAILGMGLVLKIRSWKTALMIVMVAVLGFSAHLYIPIRSAKDPFINENNPSQNLISTIYFLERKQYGAQSMVERMFKRRAEWTNQFGMWRHMGFWGYFQEQYGVNGPRFVLLLVLGLFGVWETVRRRHDTGLFTVMLILISSVGLILYMNFADGNRLDPVTGRDYLEVRDRDYFFTPAFMLFGLAIGIGFTALVQFIREAVNRFTPTLRRIVLASCLVIFLVPTYAVAGNWYFCDRSRNFIPYDYGWDLLMSADENAVLFTNGDNDTFPLWCLQEAYRVRKDVRVINLSLANSKWYIKQARDYMGLELGWSEEEIDNLTPYRVRDGRTFRLQDQLINAIIDNNPTVPVNFSVTVGSSARMYKGVQIDSMLTLSGMMFRFDRNSSRMSVASDESVAYYSDTANFRYKSFTDQSVYRNEATERVLSNVINALLMTSEGLRMEKRYGEARQITEIGLEIRPSSRRSASFLARLHAEQGEVDSIIAMKDRYPEADENEIRIALARAYRNTGKLRESVELLDDILLAAPSYRPALDEIMRILVQVQDADAMVGVLQRWVYHNPRDVEIKQALLELQTQLDQMNLPDSGG